jgi:polysaccharide biosynthesis protein PslG
MRTPRGARLALVIALALVGLSSSTAQANVDWLGVNTGQAMRTGTATPPVFYDRLTGMGGNVLREDVNWPQVEPTNDAWSWGYLDSEINAAPPGVGVILMFLNSPNWVRDPLANLAACPAGNAGSCRMPPAVTKLNEWQEFVRETVSRYSSRVVAVEIWNEPNLKSFWRPNGNEPARWAGLIQTAAQAVAEVDPSIPIISGGLGNGNISTDPNVGMMQGPYLDAASASPGFAGFVDGIGIHPYAGQVDPDSPGNRYTATLSEIRSVRDVRDPGKPLWATETGYYTTGPYPVTEVQQRDWLMQIYDELLTAPDVEAMIVHALFDPVWVTNNPAESSFGIVRANNQPKPAWTAFHDLLAP